MAVDGTGWEPRILTKKTSETWKKLGSFIFRLGHHTATTKRTCSSMKKEDDDASEKDDEDEEH